MPFNCIVEMNPVVLESELSLLRVDALLIRPDGTILDLANPSISGTTFTYTTQVTTLGDSDVGNYICTATVRSQAKSTYLAGTGALSGRIEILNISEKLSISLDIPFMAGLYCTLY